MRNMLAGAMAVLVLTWLPAAAQVGPEPDESKPSKPTPRWTDGHPDLGNSKGAWFPRIVDDMSGNGGGEKDERTRERQKKMVDERVDVPFLPWAKKAYEDIAGTLSKEDPEGFCLPPGHSAHDEHSVPHADVPIAGSHPAGL